MCGLTGFLERAGERERGEMQARVQKMAGSLRHRGPDDSGEWVDPAAGIALGFRRLAILDLSPAGHQPMLSASGRYVITFNGEVYNAPALRRELETQGKAPGFRGHSDTEVLLASIEAWGLEEAVTRWIGMFAVALWDRQERRLHLVRDRVGVKPLYYGRAGKTFLFGSELKALRAHPDFRAEIDRNALALLLRYSYIPTPYSIYRGICKLSPGTILTLSIDETTVPAPTPYWSLQTVAAEGIAHPFAGDAVEATDRLDTLLRDAVALRMIADVPLGVFLSGGVDSSTVVALMQAQSTRPVKTFAIGFHEEQYNEARYAKAVAERLGTDHTELYVSAEQAMAVIPRLPTLYDEPFADASQIPTFLVSELARRSVTVSLSGDGGDELFAGYSRYLIAHKIWDRLRRAPRSLRGAAGAVLQKAGPHMLSGKARQGRSGARLARVADLLLMESRDLVYWSLVSHWKDPTAAVPGSCEPATVFTEWEPWTERADFTQEMTALDTLTYLPDDILVKVDRASMAVSLEAREPLLDHRLIEFAWQVPSSMKIRAGKGKWLLRQVLYRYVPPELIERPKMGFGIPLDTWLRGPLRDWAESLLDTQRLRREGFFRPEIIRTRWEEHLSGKRDGQFYLWDVLMAQAWIAEQGVV